MLLAIPCVSAWIHRKPEGGGFGHNDHRMLCTLLDLAVSGHRHSRFDVNARDEILAQSTGCTVFTRNPALPKLKNSENPENETSQVEDRGSSAQSVRVLPGSPAVLVVLEGLLLGFRWGFKGFELRVFGFRLRGGRIRGSISRLRLEAYGFGLEDWSCGGLRVQRGSSHLLCNIPQSARDFRQDESGL